MKTNQWIMLIVAIIGKYSDANNYKNITPMKHDIYKQLTIDLTPLLLLSLVSFLIANSDPKPSRNALKCEIIIINRVLAINQTNASPY
jgi:hypothetical protein